MKIKNCLNLMCHRRNGGALSTTKTPRPQSWLAGLRVVTALGTLLAGFPQAHAGLVPPHQISAANLNVVQNDSANTEASVTVTTSLSINDLRARVGSNRGDFNVQVGDTGTNDLTDGFILTAISQNGRYNLDESSEAIYGVSAFDGGANGYWVVAQDVTSSRAEYNANCAAAYFRYTNWYAGWARNKSASNGGTNNLFTGSPGLRLGTEFKGISSGRSRVNLTGLGINSTTDGVLLVNHAKNEGNFALSVANPDGTWEIYVKDNFGNATNDFELEQDPCAFVFIPKTNNTVVSGKFGLDATGTNAVVLIHSGTSASFSVTNLATGRYRLTIPGASPAAGVLITSCEGGYTRNFNNVVTYEADGDGWIIESRNTGVYPPELEACTNEPVASFVYIPAASPGVTVTPTNTLATTEYGMTASFTVVLDQVPTNDVTINVTSSNPAEGVVAPATLIFTSENWNQPQTVTVTGQDDLLADGPVNYTINLSPAISGDENYNGLFPVAIPVVNMDDEQAGITVTPTSGLITSGSGRQATFNVFLNHQPAADVTVGLTSGSLADGTVAPAAVTFTPANWNIPQVVTVSGVDDFLPTGDRTYTIVTDPAVSADPNYNGINPADVQVYNLDNDVAGYVWNYHLPLTVVEGSTLGYTLALATQPQSNVVIQVTSANTSAGTVSPAELTFTPLNWNVPQTITLFGVDNLVPNANVSFSINHKPVTTDPVYSQLSSTITLAALLVDNETKLTLPSGDCFYGLGMPAIGIDGQASVEDVDAISYASGSLTAAFTANGQAADRLEIRNDGTGTNQISVTGNEVSYAGVTIGSFTGGTGLAPLVVTLNASSTPAAVQQLIRSITFITPTNGASLVTRTLSVSMNDGLGVAVSANKQIRVGALRLTQYQEGGDYGYGNYYGAADIALSQVGSSTPWPIGRSPSEGLLMDWPDGGTPNESQILLRFDSLVGTNYGQIPTNAIIVSAELLVQVNNPGDGAMLCRMLIPWDATNDTWSTLGEGVQADDIEAIFNYDSQVGVEDGSGTTGTGIVSIGVTPDVQAWASGAANYGWVFKGWPLRTDGTAFSPSEAEVVGDRPRLRVVWLEPKYEAVSFQQGANDYAGTVDTNLRQSSPDLIGSTDDTLWSDANDSGKTNNTQCLLRFDNIIGAATNQIPVGAQIHAAYLDLFSTGPDAMGDGGRIYALLQPWDAAVVTWSSFGANGVQPDGTVAALTPTVVAGNSALDPDVQGTVNSFEVTADVQAWVNGSRANNGWAILPWPGGSNGWGNRSSEYYSYVDDLHPERDRPRLRVYYSLAATAAPAFVKTPEVSATQVMVRFTGTVGKTYTVFRAPTLNGAWTAIGTAAVEASGEASFPDTAPLAGNAFYRVVYQ